MVGRHIVIIILLLVAVTAMADEPKASVRASYAVYAKGATRVNASLRYSHLHQHFNKTFQSQAKR